MLINSTPVPSIKTEKFCKGCEVILTGCMTDGHSLSPLLMNKIAQQTGCKVKGMLRACYPDNGLDRIDENGKPEIPTVEAPFKGGVEIIK